MRLFMDILIKKERFVMNQLFDESNIKNMVTNRETALDYWLMKKIILSISPRRRHNERHGAGTCK